MHFAKSLVAFIFLSVATAAIVRDVAGGDDAAAYTDDLAVRAAIAGEDYRPHHPPKGPHHKGPHARDIAEEDWRGHHHHHHNGPHARDTAEEDWRGHHYHHHEGPHARDTAEEDWKGHHYHHHKGPHARDTAEEDWRGHPHHHKHKGHPDGDDA